MSTFSMAHKSTEHKPPNFTKSPRPKLTTRTQRRTTTESHKQLDLFSSPYLISPRTESQSPGTSRQTISTPNGTTKMVKSSTMKTAKSTTKENTVKTIWQSTQGPTEKLTTKITGLLSEKCHKKNY